MRSITSLIKDIRLAEQINPQELEWLTMLCPTTNYLSQSIQGPPYIGKTIALWQHITMGGLPFFLALQKLGFEVLLGACNPDSTDDSTAAYLVNQGITVLGYRGMSQATYEQALKTMSEVPVDFVADMGGDLIRAYMHNGTSVQAALEATTTGVLSLEGLDCTFPVFNWNDIALKDCLHNRYHVGYETWPVFYQLTGMSLFLRTVLVVGFGNVGRGVAEVAKNWGALVRIVENDPIRKLEATHFGFEVMDLFTGIQHSQIVVTATGRSGIIQAEHLRAAAPGTIFFNVGHLNREIDIDWLSQQPHQTVKPGIEKFSIAEKTIFLLAKGSLLNLATEMENGVDLFDIYNTVMLKGLIAMAEGTLLRFPPGIHLYPQELEREVAELFHFCRNQPLG